MKTSIIATSLFVSANLIGTALPAFAEIDQQCVEILSKDSLNIIAPYKAGGGYDTWSRTFAQVFEETFQTQATVTNMPGGGGGSAGMRAVVDQRGGPLTIGFVGTVTLITGSTVESDDRPTLEDFLPLGIVTTEYTAWNSLPEFDVMADHGRRLVIGVSTIANHLVKAGLVAQTLGKDFELVAGYTGTNESFEAILRGEIDVNSASIENAKRWDASGDVEMKFVMSKAALDDLPDLPFLAGEGGIVDQLTQGYPDAERKAALAMAAAAVEMSISTRGFIAPAGLDEAHAKCLTEAVDQVIFSKAFADAAALAKLELNPNTAAEAAVVYRNTQIAYAENAELLRTLFDTISAK